MEKLHQLKKESFEIVLTNNTPNLTDFDLFALPIADYRKHLVNEYDYFLLIEKILKNEAWVTQIELVSEDINNVLTQIKDVEVGAIGEQIAGYYQSKLESVSSEADKNRATINFKDEQPLVIYPSVALRFNIQPQSSVKIILHWYLKPTKHAFSKRSGYNEIVKACVEGKKSFSISFFNDTSANKTVNLFDADQTETIQEQLPDGYSQGENKSTTLNSFILNNVLFGNELWAFVEGGFTGANVFDSDLNQQTAIDLSAIATVALYDGDRDNDYIAITGEDGGGVFLAICDPVTGALVSSTGIAAGTKASVCTFPTGFFQTIFTASAGESQIERWRIIAGTLNAFGTIATTAPLGTNILLKRVNNTTLATITSTGIFGVIEMNTNTIIDVAGNFNDATANVDIEADTFFYVINEGNSTIEKRQYVAGLPVSLSVGTATVPDRIVYDPSSQTIVVSYFSTGIFEVYDLDLVLQQTINIAGSNVQGDLVYLPLSNLVSFFYNSEFISSLNYGGEIIGGQGADLYDLFNNQLRNKAVYMFCLSVSGSSNRQVLQNIQLTFRDANGVINTISVDPIIYFSVDQVERKVIIPFRPPILLNGFFYFKDYVLYAGDQVNFTIYFLEQNYFQSIKQLNL